MKEIPLTQGKVAIVDDCDYNWLSQWKWRAQQVDSRKCADVWYAVRTGPRPKKSAIYMHREIAAIADIPKVDHRDGNGLHNWRNNLRPCDGVQNQGNRRKTLGCSSLFKGVTWSKPNSKWLAKIGVNGKTKYLGYFIDEATAARAYDAAAKDIFGEFALLNFPNAQ